MLPLRSPPQPSRGSEGFRFARQNPATPLVYNGGETLASQAAQTRLALSDAERHSWFRHRLAQCLPYRYRNYVANIWQFGQFLQKLIEFASPVFHTKFV